MKKKLFGILLSLAMMLVLVLGVQLTAFAEDISYNVWVGGVQVTSANKDDVLGNADEGATVMYVPANGSIPATLTLNGANITSGDYKNAAIYAEGDLTINVTEDSTVSGPNGGSMFGVYCAGSVTVNGTATLRVTGGTAVHGLSYGVYATGDVTVDGKLTAKGGTASGRSCGVYANNGAVTVNGTLNATGGTADAHSYGVYANNGAVTVNGTLNATGGEANGNGNSFGVFANNGSVTVDGTLNATGGTADAHSYGVYANNGAVTVNGTLNATGGEANVNGNSYGVSANNVVVTVDGTLNATGGTAKAYSYGVFTINNVTVNGTLEATGGTAGTNSYGVNTNNSVTINKGGNLIATGNTQAIRGTVKNEIAGIGWANTEGTAEQAKIEISENGQTITYNSYFPHEKVG